MALELIFFVLAGCALGIMTGLVPGLHVNTIAVIAIGLGTGNSIGFVLMVASMSITHTFVDFIPSVLLGAPEDETFLSVLPGHRLLLEGKGLVAVQLTVVGGLFSGIAAVLFAPLFVALIWKSSGLISNAVPFALILLLAIMLLGEKGSGKRAAGAAVIGLSGLLGVLALRVLPLQNPLFCLAAGFFGASTLIYSIGKRQALKEQRAGPFFIEKSRILKNSVLALAAGSLVSMFPGIGASQAAFIVRKFTGRIRTADYLMVLGGVNTVNMLLSFFVLFAWGKTRTGSAAAVKQAMEIGLEELALIAAACIAAIGIAAIATDLIARFSLKRIHLIPYKKINIGVLAFVTAMALLFSGMLGLLFYATAAAIGMLALATETRRTNSMAFLMIPTIMLYLGI